MEFFSKASDCRIANELARSKSLIHPEIENRLLFAGVALTFLFKSVTWPLKYKNPRGQFTLWKGTKQVTRPSTVIGWERNAPRTVMNNQCGYGPQTKTPE